MSLSVVTVRPSPLSPTRARVIAGPLSFPAAIGRSGISSVKREGDGATPRAAMRLLSGYWRADHGARPVTRLPLASISDSLVWCDGSGHPLYNRPSRRTVAASVERMKRKDGLYDICLVMDWNVTSRARNRGSAIFFHLARPGFTPTEGCVAITRRDMLRLMPYLAKGTVIRVI